VTNIVNSERCVIVGASHAGTTCALRLRRLGWTASIVLIGEEPHLPYHRPPLSKDYLKGAKERESILLSSAASYEKAGVDLRLGVRVETVDRDRHRISTADGTHIEYDKLVLATGARARELPFANPAIPGVCYLRSMADVDQIRDAANAGVSAVIIGGGYIGLEAAASLRSLGLQVTVLEAMDRVLQRITSEPVSGFFTRVHREEGVDIREQAQVSGLVGSDAVEAVQLDSGEQIKASLVIIGIGVVPNTELAASAGLKVDNGICVDEFARTDDPNIYAVGDCSSFVHPRYDRPMRLESVQNANDQALTAAKSIAGEPEPYNTVPWFWSDQYDVKLQIAGLAEGYDEIVVRGDPTTGRSMSVLYLQNKKLLAVDALNSPRDFVQGKKLILSGATLDSKVLVDPSVAILND
jgi:3-phenylpropionate/trans-cinnamate dioxygenase ferredoxin reductase subunit